jgi:hypothetical protein
MSKGDRPRRRLIGVVALGAVLAVSAAAQDQTAQDAPLPALEPFLKEVRSRLETDAARQYGYSYLETQRRTAIDRSGRRREEPATLIESYPGLPGEDRWERIVQRKGKPVPETELRKKDDERRRKAERYARDQGRETPADRAKAARQADESRRERAVLVDDVFVVYAVDMVGRERIEDHDTIAFTLTPRPQAKPRTRDGRIMKSFRGRAWVSETDFELARLDVEAVDTVSIGLGLLARVHKGTSLSFTRRKVNGEAWLPARVQYEVSARFLLLKRFREGGVSEFSNYRKFTVDTASDIASPRETR